MFSRELFSPAQKYQLLVYHADAIFHDKEYRNAACKYSMALQQKKVLSKTSKVRTSTSGAAANMQAQVWEKGSSWFVAVNVNMREQNLSKCLSEFAIWNRGQV